MATPQTYTSTGDVTIPTHVPTEQGSTLMVGSLTSGVGGTETSYPFNRDTSGQLVHEVTNLIALFTRVAPTGLGLTPRAAMLAIQRVIANMLRQPTA